MRYDPTLVQPMREELTSIGVQELLTPEDVDAFMGHKTGTALVVVNSVCGCAAGMARPGLRMALEAGGARPDRIATVFAGMETEATQRARGYFPDFPPSSPSFALFKDGAVAWFIPRHRIEGRSADDVAADLSKMFETHCSAGSPR